MFSRSDLGGGGENVVFLLAVKIYPLQEVFCELGLGLERLEFEGYSLGQQLGRC